MSSTIEALLAKSQPSEQSDEQAETFKLGQIVIINWTNEEGEAVQRPAIVVHVNSAGVPNVQVLTNGLADCPSGRNFVHVENPSLAKMV